MGIKEEKLLGINDLQMNHQFVFKQLPHLKGKFKNNKTISL